MLVVDDKTLIRTGYRLILHARGIEVVGEAADGAEAVARARELRPDVVLMDIRMPAMDGLEATRRILEQSPECRVLILTTFDLDRYATRPCRSGPAASSSDVAPEHLAAAVRLVDAGDALLAPSITRRLVERFASGTDRHAVPGDLTALTPRELEVLTLLGRGLSNTELAAELTLSEATVKSRVAGIFSSWPCATALRRSSSPTRRGWSTGRPAGTVSDALPHSARAAHFPQHTRGARAGRPPGGPAHRRVSGVSDSRRDSFSGLRT
ncbi:Protein-glutamate methylesterase/protein-glutamine glutaminase [Streptomyces alboniger]